MTIPATILTDEQARVLRDNEPTLSNRQGIDLPALLNAFAASVKAEVEGVLSGTAVVLNTQSSVTITAAQGGFAGLGGAPAVANLAEADGAVHVLHTVWSGDDLVITLSAVTTADRTVSWIVDGR